MSATLATLYDTAATRRLDDAAVVDPGPTEIWDGATLARLREELSRLVERDGRRRVGVDLSRAGLLPPRTFGLLADFADAGAEMLLLSPRPHVRAMTWFRLFAAPAGPGV